jgi:hypothetical protein
MPGGLKPRQLAPKPKRTLRQRSASMTAKMATYREQKEKFLAKRPYCYACKAIRGAILKLDLKASGLADFQIHNAMAFADAVKHGANHRAVDIHHRFGRSGKRLLDEAGWTGVCRNAHRFAHDHPMIAKEAGLL